MMLTKYSFLKTRLVWLMFRKGKLGWRKLVNMVWCYVAYHFKLDRSGTTPFVINFELSNNCNENCVFCRSEDGSIYDQNPLGDGSAIEKGNMKFEIFESILRQTHKTLLMAVPYVNGEPFIYKKLGDVLRVTKECNVATMISSNGIMMDDKNIAKILDNDLDFIKVHVSGFTTPVHQIQHRVGDVEEIKDNLKKLARAIKERKAKIVVLVDYILYKHNAHEVSLFEAFAHELGFAFSIRPGNPKGMEDREDPQPIKFAAVNVPCDWLWKVLTINWNGDMLPCCDYVVWGNTAGYGTFVPGQTDFLALWNGPEVTRMRTIHREKGRRPIPICSQCNRVGVEFKF